MTLLIPSLTALGTTSSILIFSGITHLGIVNSIYTVVLWLEIPIYSAGAEVMIFWFFMTTFHQLKDPY